MPNIKGVLIPADIHSPVEVVEFDRSDYGKLATYVGGYIQCVEVPQASVWMDEEGKLKGKPTNERATQYLYDERPEFINRDVLVGDILILGGPDGVGNSTSIPNDVAERLLSA